MAYRSIANGILGTAAIITGLVIAGAAWGEENGFFVIDHNFYKVDEGSVIEITNMPPVRLQGGASICYAFEAGAAIDYANCKAQKHDCTAITDKDRASVLDLAAFGSYGEGKDPDGASGGGNAIVSINEAILGRGYVVRESCAPFARVTAPIGLEKLVGDASNGPDQALAAQIIQLQHSKFDRLEQTYRRLHAKVGSCRLCETESSCQSCDISYSPSASEMKQIEDIKSEFNVDHTEDQILKELSSPRFGTFLGHLLVPASCLEHARTTLTLSGRWDLEHFPAMTSKKRGNYGMFIAKTKKVLATLNPIMVSGYCALDAYPSKFSKCNAPHGFLITGYRKMCRADGVCVDSIKIHNSWSNDWQKAHDDGWVDAKQVFDRTYYDYDTLSWLQERR